MSTGQEEAFNDHFDDDIVDEALALELDLDLTNREMIDQQDLLIERAKQTIEDMEAYDEDAHRFPKHERLVEFVGNYSN